MLKPYPDQWLPEGVRSRFVDANGLRMHILEAGFEQPDRPCVLLLHGFPELAYSWRKNMLPLAQRGYHVVAPDLRGFGRTTGWEEGYHIDLTSFGNLNLVLDMLRLVAVLGHKEVRMVVGHDCGVQVASHAVLIRPDVFHSAVFMGAPFMGVAPLSIGREQPPMLLKDIPAFHALEHLPRPRKHYQLYFASEQAAEDMDQPIQGMMEFLRGYFYSKSAEWQGNQPQPLTEWTAEEFAKMPTYYIMDKAATMPETVLLYLKELDGRALDWLTDEELAVYAEEYGRTGFQGGLNWYRTGTGGENARQARLFAGRHVEVPVWFAAGTGDWCPYQIPGFLKKQEENCADFRGCSFIPAGGHWVQQECPDEVNAFLLSCLKQLD